MENQPVETQQSSGTTQAALQSGKGGVLGVKAGMTQIYTENGDALSVTVIDLTPNVVTQIKTPQREGYSAVQVAVLSKKEKACGRPEQGHAKKAGAPGFYHYEEFRFDSPKALDGLTVGQRLSAEFLKPGDCVDLTAVSKGKGFQGGMKRFHMAGGYKTHGASLSHRSLGSIGNRADPAKCFKNKKMPGHMGHQQVTVQNVRVIQIDLENGVMLVHGSVPGPKNGLVTIRRAVKKIAQVA